MNTQPDLASTWFNSTAGQYLQLKEQALYDQAVFDLFGFNALQMGACEMDLLRNSRIPHRYKSSEFTAPVLANNLCCDDDFLPFSSMSLDLLLLPHRLEFSARPHQTLREAERVMMPEGHLLISGFNPISSWGASSSFKKLFSSKTRYPWRGKFIGLARMKDWLALMGFEIVSVEMCCHVPPFEQPAWHKRFAFMDKASEHGFAMFGGVYFIVAKKRVLGMMPIKPSWKAVPLKSGLIVRPTQYRLTHKKNAKTFK
jgi:SAM-dependent methyltransferase